MSIKHAFSNTQANATGTITAWNGSSTVSVAASNVVRPQDWNSGHNLDYKLAGNTAVSSSISGTDIYFKAAGQITLAGSTDTNGSSIVLSAGNQNSVYPVGPQPLATSSFVSGTSGATGGSTQFTVSGYLSPIYINAPTIYDEVEMLISGQATVAGTGSASNGYLVGLYSNNNSTLSLITSYQFCHVMSQNSATAQTHSWFNGTNSAANSSSLSGNVSASFSSLANVQLFDGGGTDLKTLPQGTLYQAVIHTARTSSSNLGGYSSAMCISQSQTTGASYFGTNIYKRPLGEERFHGVFSTTLNASNSHNLSLPSAISSSAVTNTGGSSQMRMPFVQYYI